MFSLLQASSCTIRSVLYRPLTGINQYNVVEAITLSCSQQQQVRWNTSFFTRLPANAIWKGVVSVSAAGKRRGRGKGAGRKQVKDLNKGQIIGVGAINMVWPGLNAPVLKGREVVEQKKLPQDKSYLINLLKVRNEMDTYRKVKHHPLERGWSGAKIHGKWIGPPDPVLEEMFEGFDSKVLMVKTVNSMKGGSGRSRHVQAMVVTGNKNGLAGFSIAEAKEARTALKKAKNQAAQRLRFVERDSEHTLVHDFISQYGEVKVFAYKKPHGFGIVAHRCIKGICDVIGIRDMYCKVEGPVRNYQNVTKAFFLGLCKQKSFQQMADEKGLHVVELKPEQDYYPKIMASPSNQKVRTSAQIPADEVTDFRMFLNEGKVIEVQPHKYPDWVRTDGYIKYLQRYYHVIRSRQDCRVYLKAKYGQLDSFLTVREKEERAERRKKLALESEIPSASSQSEVNS